MQNEHSEKKGSCTLTKRLILHQYFFVVKDYDTLVKKRRREDNKHIFISLSSSLGNNIFFFDTKKSTFHSSTFTFISSTVEVYQLETLHTVSSYPQTLPCTPFVSQYILPYVRSHKMKIYELFFLGLNFCNGKKDLDSFKSFLLSSYHKSGVVGTI